MMTKRSILWCLLTIIMVVYLFFALAISDSMASEASCRGVHITVADNRAVPFVTAEDIDAELEGISQQALTMKASEVPLQAIEDRLNRLSNVEKANCLRLSNDHIAINVIPVKPVARVFDPSGSYYINREGKRLTANFRYQIDVPVIIRERLMGPSPESLLPLIDEIYGNKTWSQLVSEVKVDKNDDILLIPTISGHIINFGDANTAPDKFKRLFAFYRNVMPVKGWTYYDTISVKFANQVVGKIAKGKKEAFESRFAHEDLVEEIDLDAIEAENVSTSDVKSKI